MHFLAAGSILIASLPIARTDFRTKCTSISVAYLRLVCQQNEQDIDISRR